MAEVKIGNRSIVLPLHPVKIQVVPLSPLDNYFAYASYQKKVLFFRQAPENAALILKQSLAKALDFFYPFAGRVSFKRPDVQLQLHCNNAGVPFVDARTSATVAELGTGIIPSEFTDELCQMEMVPEYPWKEDYPLLSVQVTRFSCGGLSVGVNFSHQICDGVGFWYFMNSWAEIARLGAPLVTPKMTYEIDEKTPYVFPLTMAQIPRRDLIDLVRSSGWKKRTDDENGLSCSMVKLSKEKLSELKSLAPGCTSFAVSCGYCWQRMSKAWEGGGVDDAARLMVLINCREKTSWLSSNYFGNAVVMTSVTVPVSQLQNDSLASIAGLIHKTIAEACTKQSVEDRIRAVHEFNGNEETMAVSGNQTDFKKFSMVVGSPRHRIYEIDFGWGRVCSSTFGAQDLGQDKIYLFPSPHGDGGIDAIVALEASSMPLFLEQGLSSR